MSGVARFGGPAGPVDSRRFGAAAGAGECLMPVAAPPGGVASSVEARFGAAREARKRRPRLLCDLTVRLLAHLPPRRGWGVAERRTVLVAVGSGLVARAGIVVWLSLDEVRTLAALVASPGGRCGVDVLIDAVAIDDAEGGALGAGDALRKRLHYLNPRLAAVGLTVATPCNGMRELVDLWCDEAADQPLEEED